MTAPAGPRTTKFGPGTLQIGPTATGIAIEANIIGCRVAWNVSSDDSVTYLSGDTEPGAVTIDGELTGEMATDPAAGAASLFDLSWTSAGETVEFTFSPNTGVVTVTGQIVITPLDLGADKFGERLNSEFTWAIVGSPADVVRTYTATP